MKKILFVLMLALLIAGCKEKKKVYYESDVIADEEYDKSKEVDYLTLYIRCHELDSLKDLAVKSAIKDGVRVEALPDSVGKIWDDFITLVLSRRGEPAFELFDTHRQSFADYLRLDFINYGFITKVYLPYKATVSTREEYGEICIAELEQEFMKAQQGLMMGQGVSSHYENMLMDLFYAYVNYGYNDKAYNLCTEILAFVKMRYGEDSINYATMLNNKANLCNNMGNSYSAMVSAKQALTIYDKCLAEGGDPAQMQRIREDKQKLEEKVKLWQGK